MTNNDSKFTNFGFKKVYFKEKAKLVKDVFDNVASRYDLMNDIMSLGIHRLWKRELIELINPIRAKTLLDVGGGTADVAISFLNEGGSKAYVLDINHNMLMQGKNKVSEHNYLNELHFIVGDAEQLPIHTNGMDAYSISFCIRNVTNIQKALEEAYRVLKDGGCFYCLEFSKVNNKLLSDIYDVWSFQAIPRIGKYIAKNEEAYKYLVESIRKFPTQEEFADMLVKAGFKKVSYKNLTQGVACIHFGEK